MRKMNMRRPVALALILLIFMILFIAVIVTVFIIRPPADDSAAEAEEIVIVSEIPPVTPSVSPEPEPSPESEPEPSPELEPEEPETEEPPARVITSAAARMRIPALNLDYEVQSMGADDTGTMLIAPALEVVSWFDRSAIPGNEGNAIFGAHNLWRGERSKIYRLDELEIGDELEIEYDDGTILRFFLESVFVYELKTAPAYLIMDTKGEPRLTLITCKPPFNPSTGTSDNRIVAIFKEEGVFVFPDPPVEKFPPDEP